MVIVQTAVARASSTDSASIRPLSTSLSCEVTTMPDLRHAAATASRTDGSTFFFNRIDVIAVLAMRSCVMCPSRAGTYGKLRADAMTSAFSAGVSFDETARGTKNEHAEGRSAKQAMLERLSRSGFTSMAQQAGRCEGRWKGCKCVERRPGWT